MDQRLKFEIIVAFDLLIMINGLDLDCETQKHKVLKKKKK